MMTLAKVEHILRAAGNATGQKAFVLIGSSAIFVRSAIVPDSLAMSREADLFANTPDSPAPLAGLLRQMATADLKRRAPAFAPLYRRLIDLHQKMAGSGPRK